MTDRISVIRINVMCCSLLAGLVVWWGGAMALAGEAPGRPEITPVPTPNYGLQRQYRPDFTYGPNQAGWDSYQVGEQQRREAINRQAYLSAHMPWYNAWISPAMTLQPVHAYRLRRAARRASRPGFAPVLAPVLAPWPVVRGYAYGYPYFPYVAQPLGHKRIQTGPNSYIYRPIYGGPVAGPGVHHPPRPELSPPANSTPANPGPEVIPAPPVDSGPR